MPFTARETSELKALNAMEEGSRNMLAEIRRRRREILRAHADENGIPG
jgi:hypothetical protein